jgi:VIT1/CCC1 family predicted Fe2+/Mn2+ transporter
VGVAFASVLPSLLPLVMLPAADYVLAMRLSNVISTIVLFVAGYRWGRYTSGSPWKTGLLLVGVAAALVLVAIPLGG